MRRLTSDGFLAGVMEYIDAQESKARLGALKRRLAGTAGGEGIVGAKNYDKQVARVSELVDSGKAGAAGEYIRDQRAKVKRQMMK